MAEEQNGAGPAEGAADVLNQVLKLEGMISELKVLYEQYFLGVYPYAPDKEHQAVRMLIRKLQRAPFKSSAVTFKMRAVETRYNTLHTYWQRVLREKDAGTYAPDVFKANLREKAALEEARAQTSVGRAEQNMRALYDSYRTALERQTGRKQSIEFEAFQKSLIQRSKDLREKHGVQQLSFKVVVKNGKVTVQARGKDQTQD